MIVVAFEHRNCLAFIFEVTEEKEDKRENYNCTRKHIVILITQERRLYHIRVKFDEACLVF